MTKPAETTTPGTEEAPPGSEAEQPKDESQTPEVEAEQPEAEAPEPEVIPEEIPVEVLRKNLTSANAEAAKYRTRLREVEAKLEGALSAEDAEALRTELTNDRVTTERALVVENVSLKHKLDDASTAIVSALAEAGKSREELDSYAATLAKPETRVVPDDEPRGGLRPGTGSAHSPEDPRERVRRLRNKSRI